MANSLRAKIKKLRHDRKITEEEYVDIISKLVGHDMLIRLKAIDEFAKAYKKVETHGCISCKHLDDGIKCWECISEQLKEQKDD